MIVLIFVRLNFLQYTFTVMMHFTWRDAEADSEEMEEILEDLITVLIGFTALPINFPGFPYHNAIKVCPGRVPEGIL